ncbi:class I SAM-dependent methyltransferase [Corynebacterium glucuronolyticum]|uniref:Class I SAM-dependent methyltransferase n=1 Tax=Corynebacterium glucuronolyticum TaxID=39791 RepID=A0A7T4EEE9_9CORY|nr:class I SAM-dependent methyltransferase [Corynebacterium glucuronolyticum]MCT1563898.1 class I SAM-dependent methyltransferase [Corynebacterium glucuronolyticum]QQB45851.1 class I SAM-dependent methyltransferase [Corynebacterium glucuronolyticum]WKD63439.1 Phthiotriol/phenolphthiotriol dimycocerosates methyltransferase [Corynebacterium glucuronolyticum DSM 44120]SMB78670.1 Methylase involved in ubiquinone/menaquinone biosynthesis [Corynebacterium glucuronolyticum]
MRLDESDAQHASRSWWDGDAGRYHREHQGYFDTFYWCPERVTEEDADLLGDLTDLDVLEVGCGSAPCSRWLARRRSPHLLVAFDLSAGMLAQAESSLNLVQADATAMPFADNSFDVVFSSFGAIPFVAHPETVMQEAARVLRPGGRFVFSVNHPMRWIFPDDPGPAGLVAQISYFDRSPYVETEDGTVTYVETHRTIGDRVRDLVAANFRIDSIVEPEWPDDLTENWGQWSPLRGRIFPGSIIFCSTYAP